MTKNRLFAAGFAAAMLLPCLAVAQAAAPAPDQQAVQGDAEAGRAKNSMCIGCHEIPGYKSSFPSVYHVPRIIGQNARYIESALREYRSGDRNHPTMTAVAEGLSDRDIADLAAYYGSK
ncbi:MAG: cytochrome c [Burkholderiaceae bacterium]|jgi:cytochrome c553|nr:cytochrome c [Burkholderiaceae bacterium]